jgi:hypothetical protein
MIAVSGAAVATILALLVTWQKITPAFIRSSLK